MNRPARAGGRGANMKTIQEVLNTLQIGDFEPYQEVMEYCDTRVTADEGIPAVIGLDDLTADGNVTYQGANNEEGFEFIMAAGAMVFASMYETRGPEKLGNYPGIAPAMSAMAEMFFHPDKNGEAVQYREVVKEFIKTNDEQKG